MPNNCLKIFVVLAAVAASQSPAKAQDTRLQYPGFLSHAYFGVDVGSLHYPFSNKHLAAGYTAESVDIPSPAVRVTLLGYRFNEAFSARMTYTRPVYWARYNHVNGTQGGNAVRMNYGGITGKYQLPLNDHLSTYAETGLALITRTGEPAVQSVSFKSLWAGTGLEYHANRNMDLTMDLAYSPPNKKSAQPYALFTAAGFRYHFRAFTAEDIAEKRTSAFLFPKHVLQFGYASDANGFAVNDFFSKGPVPVFWGGDVRVKNGATLKYQRNVFHTTRIFSLNVGASMGYWKTEKLQENFYALSVYPAFVLTPVRTKPADLYFTYSAAGPTYISKVVLDGAGTGKRFTFQDLMGIGASVGRDRGYDIELQIGHYSNGNIFTQNPGVSIPLTLQVGHAWGPRH